MQSVNILTAVASGTPRCATFLISSPRFEPFDSDVLIAGIQRRIAAGRQVDPRCIEPLSVIRSGATHEYCEQAQQALENALEKGGLDDRHEPEA